MSITVNNGGVLRELNTITVNDGGVLRELSSVYTNDGGVLREIFSAASPPDSITITETKGAYQASPTVNTYTATVSGGTASFTDTMYAAGVSAATGYSTYPLTSSFATTGGELTLAITCVSSRASGSSSSSGSLKIVVDDTTWLSTNIGAGRVTSTISKTISAGTHSLSIYGSDTAYKNNTYCLKITSLTFVFS